MSSGIFYPVISGDDGYWQYDSFWGAVAYCQFGKPYYARHAFTRFPSVNIPQGATIDSAFIKFTSYDDQPFLTVDINIYFNDVDNAVAPTNYTEAGALGLTANLTNWNPSTWSDGIQYDCPSLISALQEVIDRPGWVSGNALQVIIKDNGSDSDAARNFSSVDYLSGAEKVELHITWTEPPSPTRIVDVSTEIVVIRSKWWLNTEINIQGRLVMFDLHSEVRADSLKALDLKSDIKIEYPIREKFLLVRYDHFPIREERNVSVSKVIQFRIYNPDSAFGIDLSTFKMRINDGVWYRYEDSRLTFTQVNYRECLVYFNPPNFTYDSQIDIEVYCEDNLNNPGIKLEIL